MLRSKTREGGVYINFTDVCSMSKWSNWWLVKIVSNGLLKELQSTNGAESQPAINEHGPFFALIPGGNCYRQGLASILQIG